MSSSQYHPEHARTSCDDKHPVNADAEGSTGCARCTALHMDRGVAIAIAARALVKVIRDSGISTRKYVTELARLEQELRPFQEQPDQHYQPQDETP